MSTAERDMSTAERQAHWQNVYQTKAEDEVSWFQSSPTISLDLIRATGVSRDASIVDIGAGASRLIDALVEAGFTALTALDLSESALAVAKARLADRAATVDWFVGDVTTWQPSRTYDVWHDRAAFHFLTDTGDQLTYANCVQQAVRPGGHVIIATFALDGPERCSGLPVVRHDQSSIGRLLGDSFELAESLREDHHTPNGAIQRFQFSRFRRRAG
jgi:2-polyprenyl-3-methyl-5-hydroxy-6-metoxy-1,4-benzoquinol methylase